MAEPREHIFPATELTKLAIQWKELTAANRHDEALEILEQIIVGSTPMFERLAQYEGFHHAVDLDTLVQSAREKVVRWLQNWNQKYGKDGRLFTWFSICVAGHTRVRMADGTLRRIDHLVESRSTDKVLTWDPVNQRFNKGHITGWQKFKAVKQEWRRVSAIHPSGFRRSIFATKDHPVLTRRGYVEVQDLEPSDRLIMRTRQLTCAGRSCIIGLYLGDGHLRKDGLLTVGHTWQQKEYSSHIAEKFGAALYENWSWDGPRYRAVFSSTLPLLSVWWESRGKLGQKKRIDRWLLDRIDQVALAYWYMDDGSKSGNTPILCTESFTPAEVQLLIGCLKDNFGISARYRPRGGASFAGKDYGQIVIKKESQDTFFSLVAPYLLKNFAYKLPEKYRELTGGTSLPFVAETAVECEYEVKPVVGRSNVVRRSDHPRGWFTPDFTTKYDITVEGHHNFVAEDLIIHNCAKHAFLSELAKTNQFKKRFHVTSDNLEKFYGEEDHELHKHDAADDVRDRLRGISVRWGDPEYIGAVRYAVEAMVEDRQKDKAAITKGLCYAYGLSPEMGKFFYNWALFAMRDALHEKIHIPFTREDLFRHKHSFTQLVDLLDIISWSQLERIIATMGGTRLKIPTIAQLNRLHQDYLTYRKIDRSDLDPESIAQIAKEEGRTPKNAADVYEEMTRVVDPSLSGEHSIWEDEHT